MKDVIGGIMCITDYYAKFLAFDLTRRYPSDSDEKLAGAVASAQVDLNPHQVDAALFAFKSPLSRGAILADEVGLGKTIEAGLVIAQQWAERKRHILIITPSNLRKQWYQELEEKFFLPCTILESRSYREAVRGGHTRPFDRQDEIIICSYQFARSKDKDIKRVPWNLVVIDEAHRLRNVYKPSNVIANTLKEALSEKRKLLLTATPLQNSLLELYGLVSFIDDKVFGDLKSFREQFSSLSQEQVFTTLKERLRPICHRTLRRQVQAYIPYTRRLPMVENFMPHQDEVTLYDMVSDYLQRDSLEALPNSQRSLITLVLRKLLASSTFAIAGALNSMAKRLRRKLGDVASSDSSRDASSMDEELANDYEAFDETSEEWPDTDIEETLSEADIIAIRKEISELDAFATLATSIQQNSKGQALLKALETAFAKAKELGADRKAIIFTESRRTQDYLLRLLAESPYSEGIVLFNGTNTDDLSKKVYQNWLRRHAGTDRVTGSKTADMRSALVDYFREEGTIMIATEAGAEGINLQFCSLVVNYDLPWNPQRIEQRIGRCHRYGQKHDVVVVNFLNTTNAADELVFELLNEKFKLFEGIFGASDEILGSIESGVDFEKRIADIYQSCRSREDIVAAFEQLQRDLNVEINEAMTITRRKLLENFDDEVREKLRVRESQSREALSLFETRLMQLTKHELNGCAEFSDESSFELLALPSEISAEDAPVGRYELPRRSGEAHLYRLNHPLATALLDRAKARYLPVAEVRFVYSDHEGKVSALEDFIGSSGWLRIASYSVAALDQEEDHLLCTGFTDDGIELDGDLVRRLLTLPGETGAELVPPSPMLQKLDSIIAAKQNAIQHQIEDRNAKFFEAEIVKLDGWAEDTKVGLERELRELDRQIKEARRAATLALTLDAKLSGQKHVKTLEATRGQKRRSLFEAQDEVDRQRENLIVQVESKLSQQCDQTPLFTLRWRLL